MGVFEKIFGTNSERSLKKIYPIVDDILELEEEYSKLSDKELKAKTEEFRKRLENGETVDDILPEAFATVREASTRVLGMKHFPVQLVGGVVLHQGRIAEMKTGEGKTLVATLPAYLNALEGKGVHIVTVNDYLAKRDSEQMSKLFGFLGLTTGLIVHEKQNDARREAYNCDITYGTNNEIGFDYLRDNMVSKLEDRVQRPYNFAVVDEVDNILIDDARTPLIISGFSNETADGYLKADEFVKGLKKKVIVETDNGPAIEQAANRMLGKEQEEAYADYDYVVEEKNKTATLTSKGVEKAEKFYGVENLSDGEHIEINHYITRALKAYGIFKKDVNYVVKDGKVVIVDDSTGRLMDGRRYSEGIHQAIEAKEGVEIQKESKTLASITFQNFFRKYPKLSGMTGTAMTEEQEFNSIYSLDVVEIPTNRPVARIDKPDRVFISRKGKLKNIVARIKECYDKGQPVLVGTVSVEKSEELSAMLKKAGIYHQVLNAKYHEQEAHIIAQAGQYQSVTIATNMAGRGTDIILGGNPEIMALEELEDEGFSPELISEANAYGYTEDEEIINIRKLFIEKRDRIKEDLSIETQKVLDAGGLYVLGTERHESRRIDNQLRGRAGRQGDVGVSEFMLSLEDDLMRIFGGNKVKTLGQALNLPDDVAIEMGKIDVLSGMIEKAQKNIEGQHFLQRKTTLEYDLVMSRQRDIVYGERDKILKNEVNYSELNPKMMDEIVHILFGSPKHHQELTPDLYDSIRDKFAEYKFALPFPDKTENELYEMDILDLEEEVKNRVRENYEKVVSLKPAEFVNDFSRKLYLFLLDHAWQDHMVAIDEFKKGIHLKAYGQTDPVMAFKMESFEMFDDMMNGIREEVLKTFMGIYEAEFKPADKFVVEIKTDEENREEVSKEIEEFVANANANGGATIEQIVKLSEKYNNKKD